MCNAISQLAAADSSDSICEARGFLIRNLFIYISCEGRKYPNEFSSEQLCRGPNYSAADPRRIT